MKTYHCKPCQRTVRPVEQLDIDGAWHKACPVCGAPVTTVPVQTELFPDPQTTLQLQPTE